LPKCRKKRNFSAGFSRPSRNSVRGFTVSKRPKKIEIFFQSFFPTEWQVRKPAKKSVLFLNSVRVRIPATIFDSVPFRKSWNSVRKIAQNSARYELFYFFGAILANGLVYET